MTPVRQTPGARRGGAAQVAQVRLQADELAALKRVMQQLRLPSTSEALREGLRLLIREADELAAAENIRHFYGDSPAPVPDGVVRATHDDLAAADAARW
jgi:Arc/MetJ-type ribon-helix-helix transcriptional regulator